MSPYSAHDGEQLLPPQPRESHAQKVVVNLEIMRSQVELAAYFYLGKVMVTWKARVPLSMSRIM